jgi:hypothetical protein
MTPAKQLLRQLAEAEATSQLEVDFDLALCARDHGLLETYYPAVFTAVCQMVAAGVDIETIAKRARRIVGSEPVVLQRVINAARYEAGLQVKR